MGHGPQPTDVPSAWRAKVGTWCPKPGTAGGRCPGDGSRTEGLPQPEATTEPGRQVRDWYDPAHRGPPHRLPVHRMASPSPASLPPCPGAALVGDGPAQLSHAPPRPTSRSPSSATPRADILSFWGFFCLRGSLTAPAEEIQLCSPATDSGQHPPLGEHQPRRFHRDPSWEESSLHPENKNLFPCSHLQPEQRPPSSTDTDLCYWRMNLLSWEMLLLFLVQQNGGLFPTQGSYSQGWCCSETSASPCVQTECSPQPSARPGKCTALLDRKNRDVSRQEGCRARTAGEGGMATTRADHRVESPQSQMPHRISGETFVFCGLFFPSHPPNLFCAKC